MKKILLIFLILPLSLFSQKTISGTVTDEKNEPLPGVSILIEGTKTGTVSDFDGKFQLYLNKTPANLIFSYVGFKTRKVTVTNQKTLKIKMIEAREKLREVVIGYGTSAKKDIAGTVSEVKTKGTVARQYNTVSSLLQGRTPGIKVTSNIGTPGAAVSVRIRGANSLRGNNEPLYVVDGVIVNSAGEDAPDASSDANEVQSAQNGLTGINPQDIKDIVILKDASATAIYGSRGANGVVLITTKKGRKNKTTINLYSSTSLSKVNNIIPVLDGLTYAKYRNESATLGGDDAPYYIDGDNVYKVEHGVTDPNPLRKIFWQDEVYRNALNFNYGFNFSGGLKKSTYYLSYTRKNREGTVPNTFLNTNNFRVNYSNAITKKLKLDTRFNLFNGKGNMAQGGSRSGGGRSFTRQVISYSPLLNGEIADDDPELGNGNPFQWIKGYEDKNNENRLIASAQATYKLTGNLKYRLNTGMDYRTKKRSRWYDNTVGTGAFSNGYLALSNFKRIAYTVDNLLMYQKRFNDKHRINATVGVTYDGSNKDIEVFEAGDFPISNLRDLKPELGQIVYTPYTTVIGIQDNVFSYLGRATYSLNDKYVFNASFRVDNSSKFKGDNKTGFFPAVSFAWLVNKEKFLENSKTISKLKFRASWGQVGNQAIKPYQTFSNYGSVYYSDANNATVLGVAPLNIANDNLTWETTTQANVGLDFGLLNNRITGSLDVYNKQTKDLLISVPLPPSSGFQSMLVNQGGLQNKGIEFAVDAAIIRNNDFSFNLGGNIAFNRNKITDLSALSPSDIYIDGELQHLPYYLGNGVSTGNNFKSPANVFIEGQPVGLFWGYQTDGIYEDQDAADAGPTVNGNPNLAGDVRFVDINGDGNISDADKTVIGDPNPDFVYGLNANFKYKNLSLNMLFNGSYGNDIMNGNLLIDDYASGAGSYNIRPEAYNDAWSPTNTDASHPRVNSQTAISRPSDRIIEDGSYFRLGNVTLNYLLNLKRVKYIKSINFFVSGRNLFTLTKYSGYDPELTSFLYDGTIIGVDWVSTPNIKSYTFGINVKL